MKIYFEIFILLLISCSGNHQQQENDIQQTNNQDKTQIKKQLLKIRTYNFS